MCIITKRKKKHKQKFYTFQPLRVDKVGNGDKNHCIEQERRVRYWREKYINRGLILCFIQLHEI